MALITGTIDNPTGGPAAGWRLRIELLADRPLLAGRVVVPSTVSLTLSQTGVFTVDLIPSTHYEPPANYLFIFIDPLTGAEYRLVRTIPVADTDFEDLVTDLEIPLPDGYIVPDNLKWNSPPSDGQIPAVGRGGFDPINPGTGGGGGAGKSTDLTDFPRTLTGQAGKTLEVNRPATGYELVTPVKTLLDLSDTPDQYDDGNFLRCYEQGYGNGSILDDDIPSSIARDSEIADWAKSGNTDNIPGSKLTNAPSGGQGSSPLPSSATPRRSSTLTGDPGTATVYSRGDHRHQAAAIVEGDLPSTITRDREVEDWAKTANTTTKIPSGKLPAQAVANDSVTVAKINTTASGSSPADWRKALGAQSTEVVHHVDTIWDGTITGISDGTGGVKSDGGADDNLGTGTNASNYAITVSGNSGSLRRLEQDGTDNDISLFVNGAIDWTESFAGHAVDVNGTRFLFDHTRLTVPSVSNGYTEFNWNAPAGLLKIGSNQVDIYKPITEDNYLPEGATGRILGWEGDAATPSVENPRTYLPTATPTLAGLMAAADKTKLDGLSSSGGGGSGGLTTLLDAQDYTGSTSYPLQDNIIRTPVSLGNDVDITSDTGVLLVTCENIFVSGTNTRIFGRNLRGQSAPVWLNSTFPQSKVISVKDINASTVFPQNGRVTYDSSHEINEGVIVARCYLWGTTGADEPLGYVYISLGKLTGSSRPHLTIGTALYRSSATFQPPAAGFNINNLSIFHLS